MQPKTKIVTGVAIAAFGVAAAGTGAAVANSDDADVPIEGDDLDRATTTALEHVGEGRVTATEEGDEDSYYEVEVTLDNGSQIDVQLDGRFNVVGTEDDDDTGDNAD